MNAPLHGMERDRALEEILEDALEGSEYAAPDHPGLTRSELRAVASAEDFGDGEVNGKIRQMEAAGSMRAVAGRLRLAGNGLVKAHMWWTFTGDPRKPEVADVLWAQMQDYARASGWETRVTLDRLYVAAERAGHSRADAATAFRALVLTGMLEEHVDGVAIVPGRGNHPPPSQLAGQFARQEERKRPWFPQVFARVIDVVRRREDGREQHPEPLEAFPGVLETLGHAPFATWWRMTTAELKLADPNNAPLTCIVLCSTLAEGALAFCVTTGRRDSRSFATKLDEKDPNRWRFIDLVVAATSGPDPVVDGRLRPKLDELNVRRQRIHAGNLIKSFGKGQPIPDSRPEEARAARQALDDLLRAVIVWARTSSARGSDA